MRERPEGDHMTRFRDLGHSEQQIADELDAMLCRTRTDRLTYRPSSAKGSPYGRRGGALAALN